MPPRPNHFAKLRSNWVIRSRNSVPGATSGTVMEASVRLGTTSPPGTHGLLHGVFGYRVVRVMSQEVPAGLPTSP